MEGDEELVFRGLILRDQLIALLKNKIFFDEGDGVRLRSQFSYAFFVLILLCFSRT